MKKIILVAIVLPMLMTVRGISQDMNLEDILKAYYKATGFEKMKEWTTLVQSGKTVAQGAEFPFKVIIKKPSRMRIEADVQGNKMVQCFDGQQGWAVIPWLGSSAPQDMTADEAKIIKEQADMEGPLYLWQEKGHKAELLGKEDLEGSSVYKIKLVKANGNTDIYFIDSESFLLLKISSKVNFQGNEVETETFLSNYKDFNGAMLPGTTTNKVKDQIMSQVVIEKAEVNTSVSDSLFMKPVVKK